MLQCLQAPMGSNRVASRWRVSQWHNNGIGLIPHAASIWKEGKVVSENDMHGFIKLNCIFFQEWIIWVFSKNACTKSIYNHLLRTLLKFYKCFESLECLRWRQPTKANIDNWSVDATSAGKVRRSGKIAGIWEESPIAECHKLKLTVRRSIRWKKRCRKRHWSKSHCILEREKHKNTKWGQDRGVY